MLFCTLGRGLDDPSLLTLYIVEKFEYSSIISAIIIFVLAALFINLSHLVVRGFGVMGYRGYGVRKGTLRRSHQSRSEQWRPVVLSGSQGQRGGYWGRGLIRSPLESCVLLGYPAVSCHILP